MRCKSLICLGLAAAIACPPISLKASGTGLPQEAISEKTQEGGARSVSGMTISQDWKWRYDENFDGTIDVCEYMGLPENGVYDIVIPETIDGKTVTGVGYAGESFQTPDNRKVKSIVILADAYLRTDVFKDFQSLESVTFMKTGNSYRYCFSGCTSLSTLIFGENASVELADFPDSPIREISFLEGVTNAGISGTETSIGNTGKENLLATINLPSGIKYFWCSNCENLSTLNLPSEIESFSCSDCENLSELNCEKSTEEIEMYLSNCPKLHIAVKNHENYMLDYSNTGITKITLDADRFGIFGWRKNHLKNCPYLEEIALEGSDRYYTLRDGMLCWRVEEDREHYDIMAYPAGKSQATDFVIPEDIKCVYYGAFDSCKFTTITIPENITDAWYWDYDQSMLSGTDAKLRIARGSGADTTGGGCGKACGLSWGIRRPDRVLLWEYVSDFL